MMQPGVSLQKYIFQITKRALDGAWSKGIGMLVGFLMNSTLLAIQFGLGLYANGTKTARWSSFILVQIGGLMMLYGFHVLRAIWQIHSEQAGRLLELENRPLQRLIRPYLDQCGRRFEAAIFGGPGDEAEDVTEVIRGLRRGQSIHIDQYQLCGGRDPHYGREKFLTVTTSETIREGAFFMSLEEWLAGTSNVPSQGPLQPAPPATN